MKTKSLSPFLFVFFIYFPFAWSQDLPEVPQKSAHWGPNCWNLALKTVGILPHFRFTASNEMTFYSNSILCRRISKDEIQRGDLGLIRVPKHYKREEYHAFYYITPELVFSKNGSSQNEPYVIARKDEIFKIYNVPPLPVDLRRCNSLRSYMDAHPHLSSYLLKTLKEITRYESDLEQWIYYGRSIGLERERVIIDIAKKHLQRLDENASQPPYSLEDDLFIQGVIRERFFSIAEQFDVLERKDLFLELQDLLMRLK